MQSSIQQIILKVLRNYFLVGRQLTVFSNKCMRYTVAKFSNLTMQLKCQHIYFTYNYLSRNHLLMCKIIQCTTVHMQPNKGTKIQPNAATVKFVENFD